MSSAPTTQPTPRPGQLESCAATRAAETMRTRGLMAVTGAAGAGACAGRDGGGVKSDIGHHCPPTTQRNKDLNRHRLPASRRPSAQPVRRATGLGPMSDGLRRVWIRCTRWPRRDRKVPQRGMRRSFHRDPHRGPRATACSKSRHSWGGEGRGPRPWVSMTLEPACPSWTPAS